jgi:chromosome segregation ATPase
MIGRVGRDPCTQLRGQLGTQKRRLKEQECKLEGQESKTPRNDAEITAIKRDIEGWKEGIKNTEKKLAELGCK